KGGALRLGIAGYEFFVFGVDDFLKAFIERQSWNDCSFRSKAKKPKPRMTEAQDKKSGRCQCVYGYTAKSRHRNTNQKGSLQVAPHSCILPWVSSFLFVAPSISRAIRGQ